MGDALSDGGAVRRLDQRGRSGRTQRRGIDPGGLRERDRLEVVMREHLDAVFRAVARQRADPLRGEAVLVHAARARDLSVGDVADERVQERILGFARDGRAALAADELLPLERVQRLVELELDTAADRGQPCGPEDLADHGRVLHELLLGRRESVEAGRDHPLHGLGERQLAVGVELPAVRAVNEEAAVLEHPHVLLGVERVPAGPGQHARLDLGRQQRLLEQRAEQARGLLLGERRDRDGRRVALAAAPAGPPLEELRPSGADDEQRHAGRPVGQVVDEVEQAVVGPVQILEHEHERPLLGQRLEQAPPGRERLVAAVARVLARRAETNERAQETADPAALRLVGEDVVEHGRELRLGGVERVALEDPGVRLHDLAERPVAQALAVGQRAALPPPDQLRVTVDELEELADEPALADPGHARQGHELRLEIAAAAIERLGQEADLALAPDERGTGALLEVEPEARARRERLPHHDRLALPFCGDRLRLAVVDHVARRAIGCLRDEDAVDGGGRLEARRRVDHVARSHALALGRAGAERDQRLARGHRDPDLEVEHRIGLVQLADRVADRERGADGPLRVVLVSDRRSEERHHGVADELLDRAAVALDLLAKPRVVRGQRGTDVLRVELLGPAGEADEVGEQHADDLPLVPHRRGSGECRAAAAAEPEAVRVFRAAARAGRHRHTVIHPGCGVAHSRDGGGVSPPVRTLSPIRLSSFSGRRRAQSASHEELALDSDAERRPGVVGRPARRSGGVLRGHEASGLPI